MSRGLAYQPAWTTDLYTHQRQQIWLDGFDYGAFGARQHLENLHPDSNRDGGIRNGVVSFAQRVRDRDRPWREWTANAGPNAAEEAERLLRRDNKADLYVSQATFRKWRSIADLTAIGACYADLDCHNLARWRGKAPGDVTSAVLDHFEDVMIPHPSYTLSTGRGLVCVWLTELLPRAVMPRWNAVQKRLGAVLEVFGADKRALDAARVFRLAGSENSRAEWDRRTVGMVWCHGSPEAPARHVLSTLADEVLPVTHAELVSLRAERAERKAEGTGRTGPAVHLSAATYWKTALTDLQRLRAHRCPEGALPEGQRDAGLRVLVDEDRKRELSVERTEKSRRRRGVKDRTEQQAARLEMGRKAVHLRASQGMTCAKLAVHFGVSAGQIHKAMRQADQYIPTVYRADG